MLSIGPRQTRSTNFTDRFKEEEDGILETIGDIGSEFVKGISAGTDQLQGLIGGGGRALVGSLINDEDLFSDGMEYYNEQMAEASENAGEVGRIEDVDGFGDFARYSAYIVGNVIPSLIGGGGAGAAVGVAAKRAAMHAAGKSLAKKSAGELSKKQAANMYAASTVGREALAKRGLKGQMSGAMAFGTAAGAGESFTRIFEETGEEAAITAIITGLASGGLDAVAPMRVLKKILPQEKFRDAAEEVAGAVYRNKGVFGRALKEAAKTGTAESVTEMTQEIIQNAALEITRGLDLEESFIERMLQEGKMSQYLNAAVAGAIGGGAMGGFAGAVGKDTGSIEPTERQSLLPAPDDEFKLPDPEKAGPTEEPVSTLATDKGGDKVVAARNKALGLPLRREERTQEEAEQRRISAVEQGVDSQLPDRREGRSPEEATASRESIQAQIKAQIAGLPAERDRAKKMLQEITDGTYRNEGVGETVTIPAPKQPEPTPEAPTEISGALPDPASVEPPMSELVGSDVEYNGNKGLLVKKDDGFYVSTQDNGDVFIESGENKTANELGVVPAAQDLEFENDFQIDPQTKKFTLRGKEYTLARIIKDQDGNPLSLAVRDAKGKKKTIKDSAVLNRVKAQMTPAPDLSRVKIEMDDLPASIQRKLIEQSGQETIADQVFAQEAIDIAQSMPNAESLVEAIEEAASFRAVPLTEDTYTPQTFTQTIRRPENTVLSEAIKEINQGQSSRRTDIDEARIDSLLTGEKIPHKDGNSFVSVEDAEETTPNAKAEIKSALVDLFDAGMPKAFLKDVNGIYVHGNILTNETNGVYEKSKGFVSIYSSLIKASSKDQSGQTNAPAVLRFVLAHELGHAFDVTTNHTANSPEFSVEVNGAATTHIDFELGPIMAELANNFNNKTELGLEFAYPFGTAFEMFNANPQKGAAIIQQEAFAQSFAVFHSSPEILEQYAPVTYNYMKNLLQSEQIDNGQRQNTSTTDDTETSGVRPDVRPQTELRSVQVQDGSGDRGDGGRSPAAEEASQELGQPPIGSDGDSVGRSVQLDSTEQPLKKATITEQDERAESLYANAQGEAGSGNAYYTGKAKKEFLKGFRDGYKNTNGLSYNLDDNADKQSGIYSEGYWHGSKDLREVNQYNQVLSEGRSTVATDYAARQRILNAQATEAERVAEERMIAEDVEFENDLDLLADDDMLFAPVSTRFPTGKGDEDPIQQLLVNDYQSYVESPIFAKNMVKVKEYSNLTKTEQSLPDEQASEALIEHAKDNLLSIHDAVPQSTRAIAKQWYKGANKIVQRIADKHGITLAQASAVAANLSPQKDWYQNASLAERVIDIYNENISAPFDDQMKARAEEIYFHKGVGIKSIAANREKLEIIQGKSLQALVDEGVSTHILGMWVRTYDQTYNSPSYRLVSPDGKFLDYATNSDGKTQSKAAWGSLGEIGKAVSVLVDGSQENISRSLGSKNKVRNFYNNIFTPDATEGYVTIDTHAVAAALMKPLSGNSLEVNHNFGGLGISNSAVTGHNGTYSIYEEAYRRAAADRGILAREMQSITWEAVRGLFTATYKSQKQNVVFVQGVWNQYNDGKLSLDEARAKINEHSGGIQRPDWERSDYSVPDEVSETSYQRKLSDRGVPRPDARLQEATGSGTRGDAAGVSPDQDLLNSPPRQGDDSNISDLSSRREMNNLKKFRGEFFDGLQDRIRQSQEFTKAAKADGLFETFDKGMRYVTTQENSDGETVSFKNEIVGLSMTRLGSVDRAGKYSPFGAIPNDKIIEGPDGKDYFANVNVKAINPDGDEYTSSAAVWKLEKLAADGRLQVMGGLRSVQQADDDFLSSPPSNPDSTYSEVNEARNAVIREEKKTVDKATGWVKKTFKRQLTSRGLLNEQVFQAKIARDGEFGAAEIDTRMYLNSYDKAVAAANLSEEQTALLSEAIATPLDQLNNLNLPDAVKQAIGGMRKYLDKMSIDYAQVIADQALALVESGQGEAAAAKIDLLNTIASNKGKYLNRSYQVFDDPKWANKVPKSVIDAARTFLESNGAKNADRIINTILKTGTAFDGLSSFISEGKLGSKDLSILKKRKDIAPEILALMGEYTDPRINFVKTSTKMSRLLWNHRFLERVKFEGQRDGFLFTAEDAPTDAYVQIAPDSSDAMNPLNGLYTTPDLAQGFKDAMDLSSYEGFMKAYTQLNSMVKYGKTVIAPTTVARNFMSASLFTVANGHFNWAKGSRSLSSLDGYFSSKEGDATAYLREITRLGVVYDSPYAGELTKALEDFSNGSELDNKVEVATTTTGKIKKGLVFTTNAAAKFYQYGDDFWKIIGFENMVDVLMDNKGLTREQAMPLAAERIRDTYPTYSLIGKGVQNLRVFPFVGTFVSFPAEIIRTTGNMFRYLKQDMADPDMRGHAMTKVAGMSAVSFGIYALQDAALRAFDVDEDEHEAIRLMSPTWSENSNILPTGRDDDGNLEYIDLTYLDPYAYWKKPLNALMRDQPIDDAVGQAIKEMASPFLGVDIATNAFLEIYNNKKGSGGRVWNPSDTPANKAEAQVEHIIKGVGPAVIQNFIRTGKAINGDVSKSGKRYELEDELKAWVGFRVTTFDPKISLHFKAYEFNEAKRDATSLLTTTFRDPNDLDDGELENAFERASIARKEGYERMIKLVNAARQSGLSDTQLMMVLRSNGVTKKDSKAMIGGSAAEWTMSDSTLKNSIKKSDLLFGESTGRKFETRWETIQRMLKEEVL